MKSEVKGTATSKRLGNTGVISKVAINEKDQKVSGDLPNGFAQKLQLASTVTAPSVVCVYVCVCVFVCETVPF
jgi:hypothetical protein